MSTIVDKRKTVNRTTSTWQRHGWRFYLKRGLLALAILLVALPILGFGYETIASAVEVRQFPAPGKLVVVDGHQMHINCIGEGSPTVVMDAGLGTISEVFEGDPPHAPKGCIAQAWSVAEVLRAYRLLEGELREKALRARP